MFGTRLTYGDSCPLCHYTILTYVLTYGDSCPLCQTVLIYLWDSVPTYHTYRMVLAILHTYFSTYLLTDHTYGMVLAFCILTYLITYRGIATLRAPAAAALTIELVVLSSALPPLV